MEKLITFYEFTQLSEQQQYDLVFNEGEFMDYFVRNNVKFALYKLYSFYVEITYNDEDNKIVSLTSFLKSN